MPLHLVHGPPNSGRAGVIRERFGASLGRDPALVVPTLDDVFVFEHELCRSPGALLGGSVLTFEGLFGEVARAAGEPPREALTPTQRQRLLRAAVESADLGPLDRSSRRPGFAAALDRLIEELQGAGLDPRSVAAGTETLEGSAYLDDLVSLYSGYTELRDRGGWADSHSIAAAAIAALRQDPDAWGARPVLLYGFNDLTVEQRELIGALAAATEVTVSLTYEDRAALADRARLFEQLRELGAEDERRTEADPGNTASHLLFHIERNFLRADAPAIRPDGGLVMLRSAGDRSEAELIGAEIARLLADGEAAQEIAIAVRDPARRGPLLARVLRSFGIPAALEAEVPVAASATGGCLLALLRTAFTSRGATDLLAYLRGPRRAPPGRVDRLELAVRRGRLRDADAAVAEWDQHGKPIGQLERLRDAAADPLRLLSEVGRLARDIAQWPLATEDRKGEIPGSDAAHELRAAEAIAAATEELAELDGLPLRPEELIATIEGLTMRAWTGPTEGRVRIASPYELRAARMRNLFVASLQDGEFPRHRSDSPFLADEQRAALGLPERTETEAEERYLFCACLSRPTHRLFLSYRTSDEAGGAEPRSPFVDDVRRLLDPPPPREGPDALEEEMTRARGLGDVLFAPTEAPSELELARALAARGDQEGAALADLGVEEDRASRLRASLSAAAETARATDAPGPLRVEAVLQELSEVPAYGGTTLEGFDECSYRWFVGHELRPRALDPDPEPLTQGLLMHSVLEQLYREAPGTDSLPRPDDLDLWVSRGREILDELAADLSDHPADLAMRRRVERLMIAFLRREAARPEPRLRPVMLEAAFGDEEGAAKPSLRIGDWALHGRIDRVDKGGGVALARDYKLAREVTPVAKFVEKGTLQLPLYLVALRELWGIDPIGGLYQPLRPTTNPRPRGLLRDGEDPELLADLEPYDNDLLDPDAFEAALEEALARATDVVTRMRQGDIKRDPGPPQGFKGHDQCPSYCHYAPICRRERAPWSELAEEDEEEPQ